MFSLPPLRIFRRSRQGEPRRQVASPAAVGALAITAFAGGVLANPVTSAAASANASRTCSRSDAATHNVVAGDTWFGIARTFDVTVGLLFKANDATESSPIYPGDVLCLPAGVTTSTAAPTPAPNSCSTSNASNYTVVAGDTWFGIARTADLKLGSLFKANDATESSPIHPGDVLCLPAGATTSGAASTATSTVTSTATSTVTSTATSTGTATLPKGAGGLQALPAQGPCSYVDSWLAPRGNGRRHEGVDLIADTGQYLYAVVDGTLTRRVWDQPGQRSGNAWWLTSTDRSGTYYFYAHLSDFAKGLKVGSKVKAGQIIGFVGKTGNTALAHLHFEIHPNGGGAINPYPTVKALGGCLTGTPYEQPGGWTPSVRGGG